MHVGLFQFEDRLVLLQDLFLKLFDFFAIEEDFLFDVVRTEGCAGFFHPMVEALHAKYHTFLELIDSRLPHSDCRRRELLLE